MVDYYAYETTVGHLTDITDDLPHAFLFEFMAEYAQLKQGKDMVVEKACYKELSKDMRKCHYHQHDKTHPACEEGTAGEDQGVYALESA